MGYRAWRVLFGSVVSLVLACGGDDVSMDAATPDGSPPDAGPTAEPPVLTPCPAGWREVSDRGIVTCDPWPESGRADCPAGHIQTPGDPDCRPIGTPCPAVGEHVAEPSGEAPFYFVRDGASRGDGSRASPFATIAEAIAAAGTGGGTIVLPVGRHEEMVVLSGGISLVGSCVAQTILVGDAAADPDSPIVLIEESGSTLENLTIDGGEERVAVRAYLLEEGLSTFSEVAIAGSRSIEGSFMLIRDSLITDHVDFSQRLRVERSAFIGGQIRTFTYIAFFGPYELHVEDTVIAAPPWFPIGTLGTQVTLRRVIIEDHTAPIRVSLEDGSLDARDVVIRNGQRATLMFTPTSGGHGLATSVPRVELERVLIENVPFIGIGADTGEVVGRDVVIRDVRRVECGAFCNEIAFGLMGLGDSSIALERMAVIRADVCGLFVEGSPSMRLGGLVADNVIGACIQSEEFDLAGIQDTVRYEDNDTTLQTTMLPVPELADLGGT